MVVRMPSHRANDLFFISRTADDIHEDVALFGRCVALASNRIGADAAALLAASSGQAATLVDVRTQM